jgi:hypothetical protein
VSLLCRLWLLKADYRSAKEAWVLLESLCKIAMITWMEAAIHGLRSEGQVMHILAAPVVPLTYPQFG